MQLRTLAFALFSRFLSVDYINMYFDAGTGTQSYSPEACRMLSDVIGTHSLESECGGIVLTTCINIPVTDQSRSTHLVNERCQEVYEIQNINFFL